MKCSKCGQPHDEALKRGKWLNNDTPRELRGKQESEWSCRPNCEHDSRGTTPGADEFKGMSDKESVDRQVRRWVEGIPLHNSIRNECTPDFSCCCPDLLGSQEYRNAFSRAHFEGDEQTRSQMLMGSLTGLAEREEQKIHIAGDNTDATKH